MSVPAVSYEDFSTSNQTLVALGGPWIIDFVEQPQTACASESESWCGGWCFVCQVWPQNPWPAYYPSFVTNISVNLADYGGATSLDFTWNYWPVYCGSNTTAGLSIPITSQVGDATFTETFPAVSYAGFYSTTGGHQWDIGSKISHNGSTSLVRGSDPNLGYIAIKMTATMEYSAANHNETLDFHIKGIGFLITTPPSSSSTSSVPAGAVAGAVVGALAFVVLFVLAVCLFQRRRKKGESPVDDTIIFTEQVNNEAPTPMEEGSIPPPHMNTPYDAAQQPSFASIRRASFVTRGPHGPPPTYGPDEPTGQDRSSLTSFSPELARFAAANRDSINETLEGRLQAAGYLPTEDPGKLTPDEWRNEYGITKLELRRLQNLYARTQQDQPQ